VAYSCALNSSSGLNVPMHFTLSEILASGAQLLHGCADRAPSASLGLWRGNPRSGSPARLCQVNGTCKGSNVPTYNLNFLSDVQSAIKSSGIAKFPDWPTHGSPDDFAVWLHHFLPLTLDTYELSYRLREYLDKVRRAKRPIGNHAEAASMDNTVRRVNERYLQFAAAVRQVRLRPRGTAAIKALARMATMVGPTGAFGRLSLATQEEVVAALDILAPSARAIAKGISFPYKVGESRECDFLVRNACWRLHRTLARERGWDGAAEFYLIEATALAAVATDPELKAECTRMMMKRAIDTAVVRPTGSVAGQIVSRRRRSARL
jgi:hypothetical protein